jgi:hypothetical protein
VCAFLFILSAVARALLFAESAVVRPLLIRESAVARALLFTDALLFSLRLEFNAANFNGSRAWLALFINIEFNI